MVVVDMDVVQSAEETGGKIGDPVHFKKEGTFLLKMLYILNTK